jgi:calcium-dependent protein kinase
MEEIAILQSIDHPNIINLYEVCQDKKDIFLIMEECNGGSLLDRLIDSKGKKLTEKKVCEIMSIIFEALNHIHLKGICHMDLKPENILFSTKDDDFSLKLIDFGLGKNLKESIQKNESLGSPHYVAPEILRGEFDIKCDIWSAGVIMCILLTGQLPFNGKDKEEIYNKIKTERASFPPECIYISFNSFRLGKSFTLCNRFIAKYSL